VVFLDYFEKEWCGSQRGWYCGLLSVPTNNNGLESTNRWFKNSISFKTGPRPRLDVLLLSVVEELKFISGQRAQHNEKAYQSQPRISLKLWRESLQYKEILAGRQLNNFFPRSNYPDPVTPEDIESYLNRSTCQDWSTFKSLTKLHQVTINSCDCRRFLEKRICIHIVARLIIEKKVSPPDEAYNFPLGQKLKPGRKKKNSSALIRDSILSDALTPSNPNRDASLIAICHSDIPILSATDVVLMDMVVLKGQLKLRKLPIGGNKGELISRLIRYQTESHGMSFF